MTENSEGLEPYPADGTTPMPTPTPTPTPTNPHQLEAVTDVLRDPGTVHATGSGDTNEDFPAPPGGDRRVPAATHRIVRPHTLGWSVSAPGAQRAAWVGDSRADAIARATRIVRKAGGGTVQVLDETGECVEVKESPRVHHGTRDLRLHR